MTTEPTFQRGYLVSCACNATSQCQFHARQPRPCPTGCGGQLNYQESGRRQAVFVKGQRIGSRALPGPTRNCNQCEHCE